MCRSTHVELFGGERATTNTSGVRLDDAYRSSNRLGRDPQSSANATNRGRGGCYIRIRPKVNVEHQSICALNKNPLVCCQSIMHVGDTVYDERFQSLSQVLQLLSDYVAQRHAMPTLYRSISPSVS